MQCMKCGRETEANQVFCPVCLASMEKSPVKPGTPVTIPKRPQKVYTAPVKRENPDEIILKLRRVIHILICVVLALVIVLGVSVGILIYHFQSTDHNGFGIGQNYSTEAAEDSPLRR